MQRAIGVCNCLRAKQALQTFARVYSVEDSAHGHLAIDGRHHCAEPGTAKSSTELYQLNAFSEQLLRDAWSSIRASNSDAHE